MNEAEKKKPKKSAHGRGTTIDRGDYWQHRYLGKTDKAFKSEMTRSKADKQFDAFRNKLDEERAAFPATPVITVRSLLMQWCDLQVNGGKRQATTAVPVVKRYLLRSWLADLDATKISVGDAEKYREQRSTEFAKEGSVFQTHAKTQPRNHTLNLDIVYLNGALGLLRPDPRFLKLKPLELEKNSVREGFLSRDLYTRLMPALHEWQRPIWCFAYYTGIRQNALLMLRREWTEDWEDTGAVVVPPFDEEERVIKTGEPHVIDLAQPEMKHYLRWALAHGDPKCPYLFQDKGEPITKGKLYYWYKRAARDIGSPGILFHDLKRTAVRDMIRAGRSREEAMGVANIKTDSIFKRYNVIKAEEKKAAIQATSRKMADYYKELDRKRAEADYPRIIPGSEEATSQADRVVTPKPN